LTRIAEGVKTYDNNMSPNIHRAGNEQFNAWLDADSVVMVREVMAEYGLNKSDAARLLIIEGLKARGKGQHENRKVIYPITKTHKAGTR